MPTLNGTKLLAAVIHSEAPAIGRDACCLIVLFVVTIWRGKDDTIIIEVMGDWNVRKHMTAMGFHDCGVVQQEHSRAGDDGINRDASCVCTEGHAGRRRR